MDLKTISTELDQLLDNIVVQIIITFVLAVIASIIARWLVRRAVRKIVLPHKSRSRAEQKKHLDTLEAVLRRTAVVFIWTVAVFTILHQLEINISALLTGAGLLGVLIGFGAQNAVRDFLAGVFVISENQYRVGDIITMYASGQVIGGVVEDLSLRVTRLRDLDGNLHIIRNGSADVVTNLSYKYANVNVDINVAYDTNIDKVEKLMNQVGADLARDETWAEHFNEPIKFLRVDGFTETAVRIKALGMVEPAQQWDVAGEFRRRIKKTFEDNGIDMMPYTHVIMSNQK